MIKKILNTFFLLSFFIFFLLIAKHYFSEKYAIFTNKSRTSYILKPNMNIENLPLLENDTNNIIEFKSDLEEFKKKRKKRFWEKLISGENE